MYAAHCVRVVPYKEAILPLIPQSSGYTATAVIWNQGARGVGAAVFIDGTY